MRRRLGSGLPRALLAAALMPVAPLAGAATYCAHTALELQIDLTAAAGSGQDNTIHVVSDTLVTSGGPFSYLSTSGFALTIDGGYDNTCTKQDLMPGMTVLDGGDATRVLTIQSNGSVDVRHLTIQHASYGGSAGAAGQIYLTAAKVATFADNVVRDNVSGYSVGGFYFGGIGILRLENNLFVGNTAPTAAAFATDMGDNSTIYITNNTIAGNTDTVDNNWIATIGGGSTTMFAYVSNTISYRNTGNGLYDYRMPGFENVQFNYDDFGSISGSSPAPGSGNNVNVDPKFVGVGDYRLQPTSPLINAGTTSPAGGLPATDIAGDSRTFANHVDLGAYESGDRIFANDFDLP